MCDRQPHSSDVKLEEISVGQGKVKGFCCSFSVKLFKFSHSLDMFTVYLPADDVGKCCRQKGESPEDCQIDVPLVKSQV